jgi:hypothetical protein
MIPTLQEAEELLEEAEKMNPGIWVEHSRNVALAAKLIANKCSTLNAEKAYILGLLHDIGRRKYIKNMAHVLEGYNYLMKKGYDEAARVCMTHTFAYKNINAIYGQWDCLDSEIEVIEKYINNVKYNEYDLLVQLCDSLVLPQGFTLIEKRFVETALKSGTNDLILCKWRAVLDIKNHFENEIGGSIYQLFPNIIENTFGKIKT